MQAQWVSVMDAGWQAGDLGDMLADGHTHSTDNIFLNVPQFNEAISQNIGQNVFCRVGVEC